MASDNLSTIRELVYERSDVTSNDPKAQAATVNRFINAALRQRSTEFDPYWLGTSDTITATVGDGDYPLTDLENFSKLRRIKDADLNPLEHVGINLIDKYQRYARQRPIVYAVDGTSLLIGPLPDTSYVLTVYYYRVESPLVADTDTPLLPTQYTDWLVSNAALLLCKKLRRQEQITMLDADLRDWNRRIRDDMRQTRANPRIRVREDWAL